MNKEKEQKLRELFEKRRNNKTITKKSDKLTLDQRVRYVEENLNKMDWKKADVPFQANKQITDLKKYLVNTKNHVSHVSVDVDATCSGLQHYALIKRDVTTSYSVNVADTPVPQDIYNDIAKVMMRIFREIDKGTCTNQNVLNFINKEYEGISKREEKLKEVKRWLKLGVTRKDTKRIVMTLTYGLQDDGIRKYSQEAIKNHGIESFDGNAGTAKNLFFVVIKEALKEGSKAAVEAQEFLTKIAAHRARINKICQWTLSDGFTAYRSKTQSVLSENIKVKYNTLKKEEDDTGKKYFKVVSSETDFKEQLPKYLEGSEIDLYINNARMKSGIAPDFVHSMDACLLRMAIRIAHNKYNVKSFKAVHDSLGVLPADVDKLQLAIREATVQMYGGKDTNILRDWAIEVVLDKQRKDFIDLPLSEKLELWEEVKSTVNNEVEESGANEKMLISDYDIALGNFDVQEVMTSKYYFS
ncbi:MAG: hypothetical protein HRU26_11080 [Psychroserpens sp.]|nr:hypothetical protein [Psychroserpens sp.]